MQLTANQQMPLVCFETFLTNQSNALLSGSTELFEHRLHLLAQNALEWFDFDRLSLVPNMETAYKDQKILSFCKDGITDIFSAHINIDIAPYLKRLAHRQSPIIYTQNEIKLSDIEVIRVMGQQGVVWHCILPLKVFGENWGAITAARFSDKRSSVDSEKLSRFKLLGEMWVSYWQHAILSRNSNIKAGMFFSKNNAIAELSNRQKEVLSLLAAGHTAKQTGDKLCLSPRTVESHKYRIMDILNLKSNSQLVQFAVSNGLIVG